MRRGSSAGERSAEDRCVVGSKALLCFAKTCTRKNESPTRGMEEIMSKKKILVVDDEELIRNLLKKLLERENHEVRTAAGIEEAKKILRKFKANLVITDKTMERGEEGVELTKHIRANYPKIKIIGMSGESEKELKKFSKAGAHGLIKKPFGIEELKAKIAEHLK